ncbi:hypothetical protein K402DRAFT_313535, partial [Aulographum hederae CBS 113979]
NIDAAFTLAFAGFLRMGEITYTLEDLRKPAEFAARKATRGDITFLESSMIFHLKRSKCDKRHEGVKIVVAEVGGPTCPVKAMIRLFNRDPQPLTAPLFNLGNGRPFTSSSARAILSQRL